MSDFSTVSMCRRFCTCRYEFLTMVTEGVVHGVHKVVNQSSFGVIPSFHLTATEGELRLLHSHQRLEYCHSTVIDG